MIKLFSVFYIIVFTVLVSCGSIVKGESAGEKILEINIKDSVLAERSDLFFGHNLVIAPMIWGATTGMEDTVRTLGIKFLRFGGEIPDTESFEKIDERKLRTFFKYCRSINAEPILQLPLVSSGNLKDRIARALEILKESMLIYPSLSYVSVGNEPDLYSNSTSKKYYSPANSYFSKYTADDYINDFTNIAAAIKAEYPGIKIAGPELWFRYFQPEEAQKFIAGRDPGLKNFYSDIMKITSYYDWLTPFIKACSGYADIVSIHFYPIPVAALCSYEDAKSSYDQIDEFFTMIRKKIDENSGSRSLPLAFTEIGITSDGNTANAPVNAYLGTFNSALWMADFFGIAGSRKEIFSVMPWSIYENWNLSFFDYKTMAAKPVYYVYRLFSEHSRKYPVFAQKFGDVRVYADKDEKGGVSIFIVNWDKQNRYNIKLSFDGLLNNSFLSYTNEPWSLTCLTFSPDLSERKAYVYTGKNAGKSYTQTDW